MGLSVRFKPYIKYSKDEAEWTTDGSEITIFVKPTTTKLDKVLSLIHELGHHKGFIDNGRKTDPKFEEALDSEELRHRKKVLESERADMVYWEDIYKDTNCKFDLKLLAKAKELDIWSYEVYYKTGKWPTYKAKAQKRKELRRKYNG